MMGVLLECRNVCMNIFFGSGEDSKGGLYEKIPFLSFSVKMFCFKNSNIFIFIYLFISTTKHKYKHKYKHKMYKDAHLHSQTIDK